MIDKILLINGNVISRKDNQFFDEEKKNIKLWETIDGLDYLIKSFNKKKDIIFCVTK